MTSPHSLTPPEQDRTSVRLRAGGPTPLAELQARYLELARLVVTHWGYLRPDARDNTSLSGLFFCEADEFLNPIFGSAGEAHRQVIGALTRSEGPGAVATPSGSEPQGSHD